MRCLPGCCPGINHSYQQLCGAYPPGRVSNNVSGCQCVVVLVELPRDHARPSSPSDCGVEPHLADRGSIIVAVEADVPRHNETVFDIC